MADIFQEVEEDVRKERYAKLWKRYGKYAIAIAVAVVLATAGVVAWKDYQRGQREIEGDRFVTALTLAREGKSAEAIDAFARLAADAGAGYRALAGIQMGAALLAQGDAAGAAASFDRVAGDSGADRSLRDFAALLAVQALIDEAPIDDLGRRLAPLLRPDNPWHYSARELNAVLALRAGDRDAARERFTALVDDPSAPQGVRARAAEMLVALGSGG